MILARAATHHAQEMPPGTWQSFWSSYPGDEGRQWTVVARCRGGHLLHLDRYEIAADGSCSPSVACVTCPFHENVRLDDWVVPSVYAEMIRAGWDEATARATARAKGESTP